ncbi:outer membrane beta-barrel protein [Flavobacterium agrisoli]|uniref:Outer membrane beta-barrel protein n=1 Tax=Flavobacterium agrisoli TaxID=2793066 RepID=A0A934PNT3_9FLAO|nr:outer membrane beta-barrel protein [Flavobacterium agrisoli]MBK0370189.1 outer membrane beta-barrel protein [Flavobacterium agrisoli]
MKFTRKIKAATAAIMALFFVASLQAQSTSEIRNYDQGFRLGVGLNGGIPTNSKYDWALGGDVRLQYDLSKKTSLTLTTGFTNLFNYSEVKDNMEEVKDLGFIPAKAGFKAFIWEDRFYLLGEVGAAFAVTNGYNDTSFLWAPGIGYATKFIDVSVRYEDVPNFDTNQVALRLAYGFKL